MEKDKLILAVEELLIERGYREVILKSGKRFMKKGSRYARVSHLPSFEMGLVIEQTPEGGKIVCVNHALTPS